jgi:membrane associated rhomboid family serine protease
MFVPLYDDNPYDTPFYPYVTRALVVVTVLVFFLFQLPILQPDPEAFILTFAVIPAAATFPPQVISLPLPFSVTLLTYMFLHGSVLHLFGNMLFLWVFGDNVEHAMGRARFLIFYLCCGAAGGFAHSLAMPTSTAPLIGASGAISGVVAAYLMLYPHARIWVLVLMGLPLRLAAKWVLGAWVLIQVFNVFVVSDEMVAWWAHVGGLAAGAVLVIFLRRTDVPLFAKDVRTIADVR